MLSPRWKKIFKDLKVNKIRSLLVILSIVMGLTGIGVIGQSNYIVKIGMKDSYTKINPSNGTIYTDFFDSGILDKVKNVKGVMEVQGKTFLPVKISTVKEGNWKTINLFAMDYRNIPLDYLFFKNAKRPQKTNEMFIEETTLKNQHLKIGDSVWIEGPNKQRRKMTITGVLNDPGKETAFVSKTGYGYISTEALPSLGYPNKMNALSFTIKGDHRNIQKSINTAIEIKKLLMNEKVMVHSTFIPLKMQHWAYDIVQSMNIILQKLGIFILIAGIGLIFTTILTIITSQTKQIGILQAIGASPKQVFNLYFTIVFIYSLIALVIAIPISMIGARLSTNYSNILLNFDSSQIGFSFEVIIFQIVIGICIPLLSALFPMMKASRITIVEALHHMGGTQSRFKWIFRNTRVLPLALLLSIRNTFRKKTRLLISIITMVTGGTAVLSVFTIYSSMEKTEQVSLQYTNFDSQLFLSLPVDTKKLITITKQNHLIKQAEAWDQVVGNRIRPNGSSSRDIKIMIPAIPTNFMKPIIVKGRWLKPGDRNVIVLDSFSLTEESDVKVGDSIVISINGVRKKVKVIGFARKVSGEVISYSTPQILEGTNFSSNQSNLLSFRTSSHTKRDVLSITEALKAQLTNENINIASSQLTLELKSQQDTRFSIVLVFLAGMAILVILVTAIGLMGTVSLNTMERTIEVGILRSMGAGDISIIQLIIGEGILIGLLGWMLSSVLSYPISKILSNEIGQALFNTPLDFHFSFLGIWIWLLISITISVLACIIPATNAIRLSIKEVLSYE
jgi:putative ABC transport system permease protein